MAGPRLEALTRREQQIIALIARGLDSRQIATNLGIAYFTVRKHRANIHAKLQLGGAAQLAVYAVAETAGPALPEPAPELAWPP